MNSYLRNKIEERASQSAVLQTMQKRAADEKRDLTDPEKKTFDEIVDRLKDLDEQIKRIGEFDEGAAKFAAMIGAQKEAEEKAEKAHDDADKPDADKAEDERPTKELATRASFGKRFVESTAFRSYRGSGTSDRLTLPGPASAEFRAAISLADFDMLPPQVWAGPAQPQFPNTVLDVIGRVATSQAAVMYLTWAPTPPADAAVVAEGALKPEADMSVTEATVALQTVAHYKAVTRQALEDIPQIQTIIQNRLLAGVRSKLEGLAVDVLEAAMPPVGGFDSYLAGIRAGIASVEANGYRPNAVLVNPVDAADLDLAAMGASFSGPVQQGSVWGLPIIPANSITAGTAYVGDFKTAVTWFDRGVTDVFMSDSHADFFLRNQLVILAEARAAFAVTEAAAIQAISAPVPPVEAPVAASSGSSGS